MLDPILTTIIAVVAAPAIMASMQYWFTRGIKKQDWARQDEVAARVETAAKVLKESTSTTAAALEHLEIGQKQIHTLVNSNLTASMQAQYDAMVRELAGLHELVSLKKKLRVRPNPKTIVAIKQAESDMTELEAQLEDRMAATRKGEMDARTSRKNGDFVNGGNVVPANGDGENRAWIAGGTPS